VAFPLLLAYILIAADMRSDLSRTSARSHGPVDGATLVGWTDLKHTEAHRGLVRMLGYMMSAYQPAPDGRRVYMFVLMPEAGHLIRPGHRLPHERSEVRLHAGA
jgi:hypothetical protein